MTKTLHLLNTWKLVLALASFIICMRSSLASHEEIIFVPEGDSAKQDKLLMKAQQEFRNDLMSSNTPSAVDDNMDFSRKKREINRFTPHSNLPFNSYNKMMDFLQLYAQKQRERELKRAPIRSFSSWKGKRSKANKRPLNPAALENLEDILDYPYDFVYEKLYSDPESEGIYADYNEQVGYDSVPNNYHRNPHQKPKVINDKLQNAILFNILKESLNKQKQEYGFEKASETTTSQMKNNDTIDDENYKGQKFQNLDGAARQAGWRWALNVRSSNNGVNNNNSRKLSLPESLQAELKRSFNSWAGKRSNDDAMRMALVDNVENDYTDYTNKLTAAVNRPSFNSWGGKRSMSGDLQKNTPTFGSWAGKRSSNHILA